MVGKLPLVAAISVSKTFLTLPTMVHGNESTVLTSQLSFYSYSLEKTGFSAGKNGNQLDQSLKINQQKGRRFRVKK